VQQEANLFAMGLFSLRNCLYLRAVVKGFTPYFLIDVAGIIGNEGQT